VELFHLSGQLKRPFGEIINPPNHIEYG
jgi:hypothetical protein